jgi:hypothetical protein
VTESAGRIAVMSKAAAPRTTHGSPVARAVRSMAALVLVAASALLAISNGASASAHVQAPRLKAFTLVSPSYRPRASVGITDDYHCTLMNPRLTQNSFVVSSRFTPGSSEVHHAVLALVPPSLAPAAIETNDRTGGKGWTCFGAPSLPNASLTAFLKTPFLSVWAPGHGSDALPKGTGVPLPAGSLVIEQVHYNLLVGDKPVRNTLVLDTVATSAPVLPLHVIQAVAPPDLPCPAGVTGPLCNRAASLADQGRRFGQEQVTIVNGIEALCGHDPSTPPTGDTATCTSTIGRSGYVVRVQPHMHLLGQSFSMVLNAGTSNAKAILSVPSYNFHYQKAYNLSTPVHVSVGDTLQINCTYNPILGQELPALRKAPPHFVTWGDGSTDEMCVGLVWTADSLPNPHSSI